ncbi:MAG: hypothetical protein SGPRY_001198, partial [Prymnesium sp.]
GEVTHTYHTTKREAINENLYLREQCDDEEVRWILLPFGAKKTTWDLFTLTFVIYTAIVLPLSLSFFPDDYQVPIAMVGCSLAMGPPSPSSAS